MKLSMIFISILGFVSSSVARVSCQLGQQATALNITLVGENHESPLSSQVKNQLFHQAANGKIQIATEVALGSAALPWMKNSDSNMFGTSGEGLDNIHGIESPVPYALAASYQIQKINVVGGLLVEALATTAVNISISPLFRGAYERLRNEQFCDSCHEAIDKALPLFKEGNNKKAFAVLSKFVVMQDEQTVRNFLSKLHVVILDISKEKYSDRLNGMELPYLLSKKDLNRAGFIDESSSEKQYSSFDNLFLQIRDRDFAEQIAELLCYEDVATRPLVVIVGRAHADGIAAALGAMSKGKVKINYFRSDLPKDAANLIYENQ